MCTCNYESTAVISKWLWMFYINEAVKWLSYPTKCIPVNIFVVQQWQRRFDNYMEFVILKHIFAIDISRTSLLVIPLLIQLMAWYNAVINLSLIRCWMHLFHTIPSYIISASRVYSGYTAYQKWSRGQLKNGYELLDLRALKLWTFYKNSIFQCMGKIFCVEFQRYTLKFHAKYLGENLRALRCKSSYMFSKCPLYSY